MARSRLERTSSGTLLNMSKIYASARRAILNLRDVCNVHRAALLNYNKMAKQVEEEGVIASSATAVVITTRGYNPYKMIITRPFLFLLRNSELPQNYQMVMMAKIEEL